MKTQIESNYPGVLVEHSLTEDILTLYDPGRRRNFTVRAAGDVYPPKPSATASPQPSSAEPPSGADSWKRHQQVQARQAEAARTVNPQLPFLRTLVQPWHERGWDVELPEEVRLLGEDLPRAKMMAVNWQVLQQAQEELERHRNALEQLTDADQAIRRLEQGVTLPAERLRPIPLALRVNLQPSRSGAEFISPPECCRRLRRRLEQPIEEAAIKAEKSVGAPVAPAPRALPPEPPAPAPAEMEWNPFAPEHLGFNPGKV